MDSIDITDAAFSLDIPSSIENLNMNNIDEIKTDNTILLYIGAAIILGIIGLFVYKYYKHTTTSPTLDSEVTEIYDKSL